MRVYSIERTSYAGLMMYATLIETYHAASDVKTRAKLCDLKVLETAEATDKAVKRMRKARLEATAEGRDVRLVRTAVAWDDPRRENPRARRRVFQHAMRRLVRRVKMPSAEEQAKVDAEIDKAFTKKEKPGEKRTKSGLVLPGGRK